MAAMTSTFLGSAVAAKAPVKVAAKKAVAPVASLDGLKKVRNSGNIRCSRKTYPRLLTRLSRRRNRAPRDARSERKPGCAIDSNGSIRPRMRSGSRRPSHGSRVAPRGAHGRAPIEFLSLIHI